VSGQNVAVPFPWHAAHPDGLNACVCLWQFEQSPGFPPTAPGCALADVFVSSRYESIPVPAVTWHSWHTPLKFGVIVVFHAYDPFPWPAAVFVNTIPVFCAAIPPGAASRFSGRLLS
jgi:hypothetical protein